MALTGNKGEWSELYTLYKLLGEGCVYAGDAEMQRLDVCYPILNIIREECKRYEYKPQEVDRTVIIYEEGKEFARFSMQRFLQESQTLFQQIKEGSSPAFSIPAAEQFMHEVGCQKLKASSHDKSDIHLVIFSLLQMGKFSCGSTYKYGFLDKIGREERERAYQECLIRPLGVCVGEGVSARQRLFCIWRIA